MRIRATIRSPTSSASVSRTGARHERGESHPLVAPHCHRRERLRGVPAGAYGEDYKIGEKLAAEYLAYVGEHPTLGNGILLTCIVREMIDRAKTGQEWSGIHVGFLQNVNRYTMATARAKNLIEARVAKAG